MPVRIELIISYVMETSGVVAILARRVEAVALGSSAAFLTPIGHQSSLLVMGPGGYRFGDYWRLGLPVSTVVLVAGVPAILWVWPA